MNEPGLLPSPEAIRQESLWDRAPAWRRLTVAASLLTLAAVATPLLLPQPAAVNFSLPVAPSHTAMAPAEHTPFTPPQPLAPPQVASLPPQSVPSAQSAGPAQPGTAAIPSNLPVGTIIVPSGVSVRVNRHNRYAQGHDLPVSITIISAPAHGTVSTQEGTAMLNFPNAGISRMSTVTNVFYQSKPGYVGQDTFTYKRTSTDPADPRNADTYTVTIYSK